MPSDPDALLDGLDDEQRHAVTTDALPLCIVAGAGTGKTRVLTRRIAWRCATGRADARRVLALTFTRASARELTGRLRALGVRDEVRAGTFHAVAWGELRSAWRSDGRAQPVLLDRPARVLSKLTAREHVAELATEIGWAKARVVSPDRYEAEAERARRMTSVAAGDVAAAYAGYEDEKRKRGLVDFDDLLWLLARRLDHDDDEAAAQRWRFAHLYVDEFQDLNPLQFRLLEAWRGGRPDLTVVGDPNQAIYGWNGADASYLEGFEELIGGAQAATVSIARSYRSTAQVLAVANALLDAGSLGGVRLVASPTRDDGPAPAIHAHPDAEAEAQAVVRAIVDDHLPGRPWADHAVLTRTNAQLGVVADALHAARIPHRVRGSGRGGSSPTLRALLADLAGPNASFHEVVARLAARAEADPEQDELGEALLLVGEYEREDPRPGAEGFRAWLAAASDATAYEDSRDRESRDAVTLATFHAAKGLEWPTVHVCGIEDGYVPIAYATTAGSLAEERRLLYVACTRAERTLRLSWAASRTLGGSTARRRPSPFLADIQPVLDVIAAHGRVADWRDHLPAIRQLLDEV